MFTTISLGNWKKKLYVTNSNNTVNLCFIEVNNKYNNTCKTFIESSKEYNKFD